MAWMQVASFGISALGHVLNRTGGRKNVRATMADTSFIDDEIGTIRGRTDQMNDKMLRTANANTGFAQMTAGRMQGAMGVSGQRSMLDSARMGGMEQAFNAGMQNEMNSQGMINNLMNTRAGLEQFNAQAQNNATATNFQAARADNNNMFGALSAGMLGYANAQRDDARFQQSLDFQQQGFNQNSAMMEQWMKRNPNSSPANLGNNQNFWNFNR